MLLMQVIWVVVTVTQIDAGGVLSRWRAPLSSSFIAVAVSLQAFLNVS